MELFIDEAGSFVSKNAKINSWCVTGLYVYPDDKKRRYVKVIRNLKSRLKVNKNCEIKNLELIKKNKKLYNKKVIIFITTFMKLN